MSETKFARAFLKSVLFSAINLTMPDFHRIIKTEYDISGLDRSLIDGHPQLTADTGACKISNLLTAESRKKSRNSGLQTKLARYPVPAQYSFAIAFTVKSP